MRLLFTILVLLSFSPAKAEFNLDSLMRATQTPETLEGEFEQEKYLAALQTSLHSSGVFDYHRGESVNWQTLVPVQSRLVMTPDSISEQSAAININGAGVFSAILFSLVTGDWQKLSEYFEISGELSAAGWQATLLPKDATITTFIRQVDLRGGALLEQVTIFDQADDYTKITFKNLH